MFIENSLRKRWDYNPNQASLESESDIVEESLSTSSLKTEVSIGGRFQATAQEWLTTWRIIE